MRPEPLSPRDALHLAALRGVKRRAEDLNVRGKRRDEVCATFMLGAYYAARNLGADINDPVRLVNLRGYREVLTQLHVLEGKR